MWVRIPPPAPWQPTGIFLLLFLLSRTDHIGYGIRGFYRLAKLGQLWDMIPEEAQYRLKVLRFWKKYGLEATREAFGVSRRTLYRWQAKLRAA
ncbi:MAG: hypothetical protein DRG31_02835, partial [Deltaproteobacteria bacterium]